MSVYAIGDIHGCSGALEDLLSFITFNPAKDTLWLTGDLVNRGRDSLGVLRWAYRNRECIKMVQGNHDLHFLAVRAGAASGNASLRELLAAPDADELCNWLRERPLLIAEGDYVLLHAGRMPEWELTQAKELAAEASARIGGDDEFFHLMYGDSPARWSSFLAADERHRLTVNALTRLRIISNDGAMFLKFTGSPDKRPAGTVPWFDAPSRQHWQKTVVCGHWSSLGLIERTDLLAIDTGCLWGGKLTAVRLEDKKVFQVPARAGEAVEYANITQKGERT